MNKKSLGAFAAIILLAALLIFGCTVPQNDPAALVKFEELKIKYGVENHFSSNAFETNNYLSELSALRGKSTGSAAKIIDAELYSVQSFYYLSKALSESAFANYSSAQCSSSEIKNTSSFARLSSAAATKAAAAISSLSAEELKYMRTNQLEMVKEYASSADQLTAAIKQIC